MKYLSSILIALCLSISTPVFASNVDNISAKEALQQLKLGNQHFQKMKLLHPDQNVKRRESLIKSQHPFAVILTCSDSRVPPSIIFDQGLGDLFEIRNAGNVLDKHVIGSIEYAVVHLGVKLVIIMGHEDCGAVTATLNNVQESDFISSLTDSIKPALDLYNKNPKGDKLVSTIKNNAILNQQLLIKSDSIIQDYIKNKGLKIIPAYYHLDSGKVEFLMDK